MKVDFDKVNADARYSDIGQLPSSFKPYLPELLGDRAFTKMLVRPLERIELGLLSKAIVHKDEQHVKRAVDLCISVDVDLLTPFDYRYVLMWLRLNSFPRTPYTLQWECTAMDFSREEPVDDPDSEAKTRITHYNEKQIADMLESGELTDEDRDNFTVQPCANRNVSSVHQSQVQIVQVPEDKPLFDVSKFDFPRMSNQAEEFELAKDPESAMLLSSVRWIKGENFEAKFKALDADMSLLREAIAIDQEWTHGYIERATIACSRCGTRHTVPIEIDAVSFFQ